MTPPDFDPMGDDFDINHPSRVISPWGVIVSDTKVFPEFSVGDIVRAMEGMQESRRRADQMFLDALVDIINKSPFTTQQWAVMLRVPLQLLIATCHRTVEIKQFFYDRVEEFFEPFRGHKPSWSEVADRWKPKTVPVSS